MRVALVGNLAGVANDYLIGLRNIGIEADLFLPEAEYVATLQDLDLSDRAELRPEWLHIMPTYQSASERRGLRRWVLIGVTLAREVSLARSLLTYDVVHSHTGSLLTGRLVRLLFVFIGVKKYVAGATGSDLREVAMRDRGSRGRWMRIFFRRARRVLLLNIDMLNMAGALGLSQAEFFPFALDTDSFRPRIAPRAYASADTLVLFMMSRLDWARNDGSDERTSANENDRVFVAFARFVRHHHDTLLVVSYRGADREEAKQLVETLGISDKVRFVPPMTRAERITYMVSADVCLDQFGLGAYGLGAVQSMACAKPLITYVKKEFVEQCGLSYPPILNARTSDEIYNAMVTAADAQLRAQVGHAAREWVIHNHGREKVCRRLLRVYEAK